MTTKDKYQNVNLYVWHNLYLTKEQRYDLINRKAVKCVGVSLPVWYKDKSSEPANEVFCEYHIENKPGKEYVRARDKHYNINLPQSNLGEPEPVDYDLISKMPKEQYEAYLYYRTKAIKHMDKQVSADNLRDIQDAGSEYLRFETSAKGNLAKDRGIIVIIHHVVEIKTIELLEQTLIN